MSDCRDLEPLLASDDPEDRARAARHALACAACRPLFDAEKRLAQRIEAWDPAVAPPPALEERVREGVRRRLASLAAPGGAAGREAMDRGQGRRRLALAAALLLTASLGIWLGYRPSSGPSAARDLLVAGALADARRAERQHARAIASLDAAVAKRLARADDPRVPASEAALLMAYRDRIASLESTIAEIEAYLRNNPSHPGARTVLLAAYRDKTEVLREILALGERT